MEPVVACALRRAALTGGALAATLVAHALAVGGLAVLPIAPFLWAGLLSMTVIAGAALRRPDGFAVWGPGRVLALLVALQAAMHAGLHEAPWAFGVAAHAHGPLIDPAAVVLHIAVALVLTAALLRGQGVLARLVAIARALVAPPRRRGLPRAARVLRPTLATPPVAAPHRPRTSRGPPAGTSRPAIAAPAV